jgi:hypothetical protein
LEPVQASPTTPMPDPRQRSSDRRQHASPPEALRGGG